MSDTAAIESGTRLQNFLDRAGFRGFPWKTATILYTISWGWLFIVRDSYWSDDWERFPKHGTFNVETWDAHGLAPWLRYERKLYDFVGPSGLRALIFAIFLMSALFLYAILGKFFAQNLVQKRFSVLVFLVLPFNTARVSLQTIHYSNSYFLFYFAWYLLVSFKCRKASFLSKTLFFLSFGMHSLLPFYFLPVIHKLWLSQIGSIKILILATRRNISLLALPFLYWMMRAIFWPEEIAYHDVGLAQVSNMVKFILFSGLLLFLVFVLQRKIKAIEQSLRIIFIGILCLFFGIIAYVALGFFPNDWSFLSTYIETFLGRSDWYSRHQTLQPLGAALLIVGVVGSLTKCCKKFAKLIQALTLAVCVVFNMGFGFEYVVDHAKQKEVVRAMKEYGESKSGSDYQFVDQSTLLNARGRAYRERDWRGLIWLAYGVESMQASRVETVCESPKDARLVLIRGSETHWEALKNWVSDGYMGFEVTVDDTPGACKPEMVTSERVSGAIPILFYFTGVKG